MVASATKAVGGDVDDSTVTLVDGLNMACEEADNASVELANLL